MASPLEPNSSYARSATAESSAPSQTREKKWKAPVWTYCRRPIANKKHQDHLYCSYCPDDSKANKYKEPYSSTNSTNMAKHLLAAHQIKAEKKMNTQQAVVVQQLNQFYHQAQAIGETDELDAQILKDHLNKTVITKALISIIIVRNLAYTIVEWPEFHTLCQALNRQCKGMITTTHSEIALRVKEA